MANAPLNLATPVGKTTLAAPLAAVGPGTTDVVNLTTLSVTVGAYTVVTASQPQWMLAIDGELMDVDYVLPGSSSTSLQVTRGTRGTNAVAHGNGAIVWAAPASNMPVPSAFTSGMSFASNLAFPAVNTGFVAYTSIGTSSAPVAGTLYVIDVDVPAGFVATGIAALTGTATTTTDTWYCYLLDLAGEVLATGSLTLASPATSVYQKMPFANTVFVPAGRYFIGVQSSGTTANSIRFVAASTVINKVTTSVAGTAATAPAITTIPTTFTATVGPVAYLY